MLALNAAPPSDDVALHRQVNMMHDIEQCPTPGTLYKYVHMNIFY